MAKNSASITKGTCYKTSFAEEAFEIEAKASSFGELIHRRRQESHYNMFNPDICTVIFKDRSGLLG